MSALLAVMMTAANPNAAPVALPDPVADPAQRTSQSNDEIVVTGARTEGSSDYTIPGQT
jgi:outer membrane receptor for ferric coprogen and ferric-rhodotorulic acid